MPHVYFKQAPRGSSDFEEAEIPLVGGERLLRKVANALEKHESLLLLGPAGAGKTRILRSALAFDGGRAAQVRAAPALHGVLVSLSVALLQLGHRTFSRMIGAPDDAQCWLTQQTSVRLKGLLWDALEQEPVPIVLDDIRGAGNRTMRFFHRLYFAEGMTIIAAARDFSSLGALQRLFFDPRHIMHVPPLKHCEAERLFELAVNRFRLDEFDLDEFRPRVLASAAGNPGQIIEMCRRARLPQYRIGSHIKFSLVRIDTVARFLE